MSLWLLITRVLVTVCVCEVVILGDNFLSPYFLILALLSRKTGKTVPFEHTLAPHTH